MRRVGLHLSMLAAVICLLGVVKGLFSLFGSALNLPPGNAWAYFLGGIALFWIGAFMFSPRQQRESDARSIWAGAHRWWTKCAQCGAGLDKGELGYLGAGSMVLPSMAYLCRKCGATTCGDCFNQLGKCANCGASDVVKEIEVVSAWKQRKE